MGGLTEILGGLKQLEMLIANGTAEEQASFTDTFGLDRGLNQNVDDKAFTGFIKDFLDSINGYRRVRYSVDRLRRKNFYYCKGL